MIALSWCWLRAGERRMLIGFVSAKGSPGVTTAVLALAAAWPRTAIVIDADPAGGDVAAGLGRGAWPPASQLLELAVQSRMTTVENALRRLVVRSAEHTPLALAGLGSPVQAATMPWRELGLGLAGIVDADVLCDGGRYVHGEHGNMDLLRACDRLVLVTGSSLPSVRATARLAEVLHVLMDGPTPTLLVIDPGHPYDPIDIRASCGGDGIVELPHDPRTAGVWSHGDAPGRHLDRTPLQRSARRVAAVLASAGTAEVTS